MRLDGWVFKLADVADHTFVRSANGKVYECWGGKDGPDLRVVGGGEGNDVVADCYRGSLPGLPDTACIGVYGVHGVCHQSANCFLYSADTVLDVRLVRGAWASYMAYGTWGLGYLGWLAVYHGCAWAAKTTPSQNPVIERILQARSSASKSGGPFDALLAEFDALTKYYVPAISTVRLDDIQLEFLLAKSVLEESGYQGNELAFRLNDLVRSTQEQLRARIGDAAYKTLMGVDDASITLGLIEPTLADVAGVPTGPADAATFVSQQVPKFMLAGNSYSVMVTMRNTGTLTWKPGRYALGSQAPDDNLRWGLPRVALPDEVPPGTEAVFTFDVVAPLMLDEPAVFRWRMVRENVGWFGERNLHVEVTVAKDAQFVTQSVPAAMVAGTTQQVAITMRNISGVTWPRAGQFKLGSQNPVDNTAWGTARVEMPHDVPSGTEVVLTFPVRAPTAIGHHNFQWRMVRDAGTWLGQRTPNVEMRVMPPLTRAAAFVRQIVPTPLHPGAVQYVAVTMRNVGTETWTNATSFKLGSKNPQDNVRWGTNRVPLPHDVPPNAEVTFVFGITAREAAGTWNFQWQMVREGVEWFGQLTPNVEVTVAPQQTPLMDLWFLKTKNVSQGKVEAFTATKSSSYGSGLSSVTRFGSGDAENGWFGMHRNGDVYFVKTRNTASGAVEVFTATRSSGYANGISAVSRFHTRDAENGRFGMLPNGDLYFLKTRNTGSGTVEAFTALRGDFSVGQSLPTRFAIAEGSNGWFGMLPNFDVYFVKTRNTGSGKVEVLTATSASAYGAGAQAPTRFHGNEADNGTFGMLPNGDVFFVKTRNTASGRVEVSTATRASSYASGLAATSRFSGADGLNGSWGMV